MSACRHESLEFVGEEKTDDGVNTYYRCKACGDSLVLTPARKVYGIPGFHSQEGSRTTT